MPPRARALGGLLCLAASAASAQFGLPSSARLTLAEEGGRVVYPLPVRPFADDASPVEPVEGVVETRVFALEGEDALAVADVVASHFAAEGYREVLRCSTQTCGGFDFRLAAPIAPMPYMRVDLADFHQITLRASTAAASVFASAGGGQVFVQVTTIAGAAATNAPVDEPEGPDAARATAAGPAAATPKPPPNDGDVGRALDSLGFATLEGVDFRQGSLAFAEGAEVALDLAAAALRARPELQVAVVGHTDNQGSLAVNLDVGRRRAAAVAQALQERGVEGARLTVESAAWLAPRASNADAAGRARNRRVVLVVR